MLRYFAGENLGRYQLTADIPSKSHAAVCHVCQQWFVLSWHLSHLEKAPNPTLTVYCILYIKFFYSIFYVGTPDLLHGKICCTIYLFSSANNLRFNVRFKRINIGMSTFTCCFWLHISPFLEWRLRLQKTRFLNTMFAISHFYGFLYRFFRTFNNINTKLDVDPLFQMRFRFPANSITWTNIIYAIWQWMTHLVCVLGKRVDHIRASIDPESFQ